MHSFRRATLSLLRPLKNTNLLCFTFAILSLLAH